jgi:hypothetical protein
MVLFFDSRQPNALYFFINLCFLRIDVTDPANFGRNIIDWFPFDTLYILVFEFFVIFYTFVLTHFLRCFFTAYMNTIILYAP